MEREISVADVRTFETKGGSKRFVLSDEQGNEYTTFREQIGESALGSKGSRRAHRVPRAAAGPVHERLPRRDRNPARRPRRWRHRPGGGRVAYRRRRRAVARRHLRAEQRGPARRALREAEAVQGPGERGHQGRRRRGLVDRRGGLVPPGGFEPPTLGLEARGSLTSGCPLVPFQAQTRLSLPLRWPWSPRFLPTSALMSRGSILSPGIRCPYTRRVNSGEWCPSNLERARMLVSRAMCRLANVCRKECHPAHAAPASSAAGFSTRFVTFE